MNKTVKTIAWICLVLGVMGLAADAIVLVRGRRAANEMQAAIAAGELPAGRFFPGRKNADGDFSPEAREEWREENRENGQGGLFPGGARGGGGLRRTNHGVGRAGRRTSGSRGFRVGLPLFWMALGPVLLAVGAVILIVNREPKRKAPAEKKAKK